MMRESKETSLFLKCRTFSCSRRKEFANSLFSTRGFRAAGKAEVLLITIYRCIECSIGKSSSKTEKLLIIGCDTRRYYGGINSFFRLLFSFLFKEEEGN